MFASPSPARRFAMLFLALASALVSSGRVVHAHGDGGHIHHHPLATTSDCCRDFAPWTWHAHVHLLGMDIHVPVESENNNDPRSIPGDERSLWSDTPHYVDCELQLAVSELPLSLDRPEIIAAVGENNLAADRTKLSLLYGRVARVRMSSLTR